MPAGDVGIIEADNAWLQAHTCALAGSSGGVWCWGNNVDGQVQSRFVDGRRVATAMSGGRICDVVVTPCDLRRLEVALLAGYSLLLLYLG